MELYNQIIEETNIFDKKFRDSKKISKEIKLNIPKDHERFKEIKSYTFSIRKIEEFSKSKSVLFIIDKNLKNISFLKRIIRGKKSFFLESVEYTTKTEEFLNKFISRSNIEDKSFIIVIGGGILSNCGAYIAEKTKSSYIIFPTTILSMSDGSIGGKVRLNSIKKEFVKHSYKSYYEPNAVYLDPRFLESLDNNQKIIGIVEIIKHSLFQSEELYKFLFEKGEKIFSNKKNLLKAIFWTVNLKKICLDIDPKELLEGSGKILRAGHDLSDKIEEESGFKVPHGSAVSKGIIKQLSFEKDFFLLKKAKKIFDKFNILTDLNIYEFKK